ncbi:prepilin-type N-terminal cleavage/methylation domain-containing protein [Isosphaeraceae bacterium EP7]
MRSPLSHLRCGRPRRGMTLVEMMVVVALVVLMMSILVSIFSSATGAISSSRVFVELDSGLRGLDATIRRDLAGVTARMTPPLDPSKNLGYFEYAENSFSDAQGEDGDDTLSFTTKAPEGQKFTGRFYVKYLIKPGLISPTDAGVLSIATTQPTLISSDFAEIIYFLRNGNLYRRVLLIVPEKQGAGLEPPLGSVFNQFTSGQFNLPNGSSWQGLNDVSARPSMVDGSPAPILNTLGDLTNRQNRYARPRFSNDYATSFATARSIPDGLPDDGNADGLPDYYPTMYAKMMESNLAGLLNWTPPSAPQLFNFSATPNYESIFAFPYIYPASYSKPDPTRGSNGTTSDVMGWIRSAIVANTINQCPLEIGDNLITVATTPAIDNQSWWGYPTWRETMSPKWGDPVYRLNSSSTNGIQASGIQPQPQIGSTLFTSATANWVVNNMLPPVNPLIDTTTVTNTNTGQGAGFAIWANNLLPTSAGPPPGFTDNAGFSGSGTLTPFRPTGSPSSGYNPNMVWEDDLILTGVRSFDVKAYDDAYGGYQDLGWGNKSILPADDFSYNPSVLPNLAAPSTAIPLNYFLDRTPFRMSWNNRLWKTLDHTFAHEGRIPPLVEDGRYDAQSLVHPLGDNTPGVIRMRRVWDSWSTDYTRAPATNILGQGWNPPLTNGLPLAMSRPAYPSFPPPYPMPLRGIQINVRLVDPRNEKVRSLTITQDFSDKL